MKKFITIFMIIITTFCSAGCKGIKHEIEELAPVVAVGFDLTLDNKYLLTARLLNPQKGGSGGTGGQKGGGQEGSSDIMIYSMTGDTPADAFEKLSTKLGRELFLSTARYGVVGRTLAESGLSLYVESALRSYQVAPDLPLFVTKGQAADVITSVNAEEKAPGNVVKNLIMRQSVVGYSPVVTNLEFANALSSKTAAPILGVIYLDREESSGGPIRMAGTAVFKKDKLIGFLDINQTRGMNFIKDNVKDGEMTVSEIDGGSITFRILKASSKIKPIIINDSVIMQINIKIRSAIREMTLSMDPMKNPKVMDDLSEVQNKAIEKQAKLALEAAQKKFKADIFDFGGIIHRDSPEIWERLEKDWENTFPDIKVEVKVNSTIINPGPTSKPIK